MPGWNDLAAPRDWAKLREACLSRDRHVCQVPVGVGVCGRPAKTAGHIVARALGGRDVLENLRAECAQHNYSDGAAMGNRMRARRPRSVNDVDWPPGY